MPDHLYNPKAALFCAYPPMKTLSKQANDLMEGPKRLFPSANWPVATPPGRGIVMRRRNGASAAQAIMRRPLSPSSG
jgi:hypothetical protein